MDDAIEIAQNVGLTQTDNDDATELAQFEMELKQWEMVSDEAWAMIDEWERQEASEVDTCVVLTEKPEVKTIDATQ